MTDDDLPEPLVPPDCDLTGYPFMPLHGTQLFSSEFNSTRNDKAWRAGVTLWWAAWLQQPAASLPSDDEALARLAGFGYDIKGWRKVKAIALHNFVRCSDGRLYHTFLADKAIKAWESSHKNRERQRKHRDKEKRQRQDGEDDVGVTVTETSPNRTGNTDVTPRIESKKEDEGRKQQDFTTTTTIGTIPPAVHGTNGVVGGGFINDLLCEFKRLREKVYGKSGPPILPDATLRNQARKWDGKDIPLKTFADLMLDGMQGYRRRGQPAPRSLDAFKDSFGAAIEGQKHVGEASPRASMPPGSHQDAAGKRLDELVTETARNHPDASRRFLAALEIMRSTMSKAEFFGHGLQALKLVAVDIVAADWEAAAELAKPFQNQIAERYGNQLSILGPRDAIAACEKIKLKLESFGDDRDED